MCVITEVYYSCGHFESSNTIDCEDFRRRGYCPNEATYDQAELMESCNDCYMARLRAEVAAQEALLFDAYRSLRSRNAPEQEEEAQEEANGAEENGAGEEETEGK